MLLPLLWPSSYPVGIGYGHLTAQVWRRSVTWFSLNRFYLDETEGGAFNGRVSPLHSFYTIHWGNLPLPSTLKTNILYICDFCEREKLATCGIGPFWRGRVEWEKLEASPSWNSCCASLLFLQLFFELLRVSSCFGHVTAAAVFGSVFPSRVLECVLFRFDFETRFLWAGPRRPILCMGKHWSMARP